MQDRVLLGLVCPKPDLIKALADAMYELQAMRSPNRRQQVLEWVRARDRAFDPPRSDRDMVEIKNFIIACGADDESFDLLLEAIEVFTPDDDPNLLRLKDMVNRLLLRSALKKSELRELLALEPDEIVTTDQLGIGIERARPALIAHSGGGSTPGCVREAALLLLNGRATEEGLCPLLRFVEWLADLAPLICDSPDSSKERHLRDWAERVSSAHGLTAAAWRAPLGPVRRVGEPALLIELERMGGDRFTLRLWVWVPGSGAHTLEWGENWCRLDELRSRLDDLLELASRELAEIDGRLRVEFWLDFEIFQQDVDWWMFGANEGFARPLGAEYAVLVRRRGRTAKEQRAWKSRWEALKQVDNPVTELVVWVRNATSTTVKELWDQLSNDRAKVLVAPVGTCGHLDGEMKRILLFALTQGMPVVLCVRRAPADAGRYLESLGAALSGVRLPELPELVRDWRRQAFTEHGDHFGHHLVLFWDDYDRPLPGAYAKLALPVARGVGQ